nr:hypothetical protein [Tanacetum cinerariifolium]
EAVRKELGDSLVRVATTASSLEEEQDSGAKKPCGILLLKLGLRVYLNISMITAHKRVKKLEKRNRSRTHKLKRLYKIGLIARVESSDNEESLGKDASKQGRRIVAIDVDNEITLVNDADNEMFDVDDLGGEEVFIAEQEVVSTAATTETEALKTSKPNVKAIVFQETHKSSTTTFSLQQSQDKGK